MLNIPTCIFFYSCFATIFSLVSSKSLPTRAYSVFGRDETELHKYSAILAASEPQRVFRDEEIKTILNPISYWLCKRERDFNNPESKLRQKNQYVDDICEDYEKHLLDLVNSYGLDSETFNALSAEIAGTPSLRKKVMLQAFHYKLAADLDSNTVSRLKVIEKKPSESVAPSALINKFRTVSSSNKNKNIMVKFCAALKEVEAERLEVRRALLRDLGIKEFPKNMCEPSVYPAMAPCIQNACVHFPKVASTIIDKYGLEYNDFNRLLDKTKSNFLFRLRVIFNLKFNKKLKNSDK